MMPANTSSDGCDRHVAGEIADIGAVWVPVDDAGVRWPEVDDRIGRWRQTLVLESRYVRCEIERRLDEILSGTGEVIEVIPGVMAVGSPIRGREGDRGGFAVLPVRELATEGSVGMLCQAARLDETLVRGFASEASMPPRSAVPSIAVLIRRIHRSGIDLIRDRESQQSVDRRLAESYEELHLLNSLIDDLVIGGDSDEFLRRASAELAATAGYRWIAVLVDETTGGGEETRVVHGEGTPSRARLRSFATRAGDAHATALDTDDLGEVCVAAVRGGERRLGTLIAGGREGDPISSVELTLLASAAGHIGVFLRNAMLYADLDAMFLGTLQAMVAAIDAKDPYTRGHSQRVAELSRDLAAAIGLDERAVRNAHLAGLVHDIGKIGVPESVLRKSGSLEEHEFAEIRRHPQTGYRILRDIPQIRDLLPGVLCHHESWDGGGYPAGLAGREIPLVARIVAICDSFDAMSSNRTYRAARPRDEVFAEIRRCAGVRYDPDITPVFLALDFTEYDRLLARDARESSLDLARPEPGSSVEGGER